MDDIGKEVRDRIKRRQLGDIASGHQHRLTIHQLPHGFQIAETGYNRISHSPLLHQ